MIDLDTKLARLQNWQYLNVANFLVSCAILIVVLF